MGTGKWRNQTQSNIFVSPFNSFILQGMEKKTETMEIQVKKIQDLEKRMKKEEDSLIVTNKQIESVQSDIKQGKNNLNDIKTIFKYCQ